MEVEIDDQPFWQEAHEAVSQYEFDEAERIFQEALTQYPNHPRILDALGGVLVQRGNFDKARMVCPKPVCFDISKVFNLSIKLAPEEGPEKYLNMGQLSSGLLQSCSVLTFAGKESVEFYKKGIQILNSFKTEVSEEEFPLVIEQLVSAYCSVAEIFMTDECFDPNAESECGNALQEALKLDPNNVEALQTMASYKISQQNPEEALKFLKQSYEGWRDIDPIDFPEFEFRVQTAKLFMELDDFKLAADILESLLNEDDEISELWYLLGFAEATIDPEHSLECLQKSRELLVATNCPEKEIFDQVDEQIKRVTAILEERGPQEMNEEGDDVEVEDDQQ